MAAISSGTHFLLKLITPQKQQEMGSGGLGWVVRTHRGVGRG